MVIAEKYLQGRVIAFLEGGYNLQSLVDSVTHMMDKFANG